MPLKILLFLFISISLYADVYLKSNYYVSEKDIMLWDIDAKIQKEIKLFQIDENRHSKRVKSKELIKLLKTHGINNYKSKHAYVQFTQKSPIDTLKIESAIKKLYQNKYKNIDIKSISVEPRAYLQKIPLDYEVLFTSKSHLSNVGILYIKTDEKKKIFFNYKINAKITVYEAKKQIAKGNELSNINCKKKSIILDKFRAMPLQSVNKGTLESKRKMKAGTIVTIRDTQGLYLVKRGSNVNVALKSSTLSISFSAKALQNGRYGDTIKVLKSNGTKIKARVTGKHRAEVR